MDIPFQTLLNYFWEKNIIECLSTSNVLPRSNNHVKVYGTIQIIKKNKSTKFFVGLKLAFFLGGGI